MPVHFEFDPEHRILLVVAEGDVQDAEILTINDLIGEQVNRLHPFAGISDLSSVTTFNVSSQAMRTAALQPSPYPEETPRFIVAPHDYLFGMARMYELVGNRTRANLRVVRRREEALAMLGVQNPKFEPVS